MNSRIKKGITYVFIANMLTLIINILTNFLLPKYMSIDTYAAVKTFQLYMNYIGVFHLGFIDGIYLRYGGKSFQDISIHSLGDSISTARIFQFAIMAGMVSTALLLNNPILVFFSLAIFPINIVSYYRMLFQAVGEFGLYRKITNYTTICTFGINIFLLLVIKSDDYYQYLSGYIIVYILVWCLLEIYACRRLKICISFIFDKTEFARNIQTGFFLMCGNFATFLLSSMDRLFVKANLDNYAFAQYSFAVSLENMLNLAITPITIPLYNYFCIEKKESRIRFAHDCICLFSSFLISSAFVAKFVVELYLPQYVSSCTVIFLLFGGQAFQFIVKAVYINLYKADKRQKTYFIKLSTIILLGAVLNHICFSIMGTKESFAVGTLLCSVFWCFLSFVDYLFLRIKMREIVYLLLEVTLFIVAGHFCNSICGLFIYLLGTVALSALFMKNVVTYVIYKAYNILLCRRNIL